MGLGVSLILIAVGAVLAFAVHVDSSNAFDVNTIGIILLVVVGGPRVLHPAAHHLRRRKPVGETPGTDPATRGLSLCTRFPGGKGLLGGEEAWVPPRSRNQPRRMCRP